MIGSSQWLAVRIVSATLLVFGSLVLTTATLAEPGETPVAFAATAAAQPPVGIDIVEPLEIGEWRISYRFLGRFQRGNQIGTKRVSEDEASVAADPPYTEVPRSRDTKAHIMGISWAAHERITLVARLPIMAIDESATGFGGAESTKTSSNGTGDLAFGMLVPFMRRGEQTTSVSLMVGAPTGSIIEGPIGERLAYPMQPGSGSWTLSPGFNYKGRYGDFTWGGQFGATFALSRNSLHYEQGTEWRVSGWLGWGLADWLSISLRSEWDRWGNIGGEDAELPFPYLSPAQDPTKQRGDRVDMGPGINILLPCCGAQRFALEAMFPLYQDLDGPQLANDWVLNASWQVSF
jgi:hypothetical protein